LLKNVYTCIIPVITVYKTLKFIKICRFPAYLLDYIITDPY